MVVALGVIIHLFEVIAKRKKLVAGTCSTNFPDDRAEHVGFRKYTGAKSPAVSFENRADLLNNVAQFTVPAMIKIHENFPVGLIAILGGFLNIPFDVTVFPMFAVSLGLAKVNLLVAASTQCDEILLGIVTE